jgi:hypothetical protein
MKLRSKIGFVLTIFPYLYHYVILLVPSGGGRDPAASEKPPCLEK